MSKHRVHSKKGSCTRRSRSHDREDISGIAPIQSSRSHKPRGFCQLCDRRTPKPWLMLCWACWKDNGSPTPEAIKVLLSEKVERKRGPKLEKSEDDPW